MRQLVALLLLLTACKESGDAGGPVRVIGEKTDIASREVKVFAFEAYPQWAAANPSKACPDSLEPLLEYTTRKTTKDPWGGSYKMMCGPNLPAGVKGLAVISFGPDGKEGTPDDVRSWEGAENQQASSSADEAAATAKSDAEQRFEQMAAQKLLDELERQAKEVAKDITAATAAVSNAQNEAERNAAKATLGMLQADQELLEAKIRLTKAGKASPEAFIELQEAQLREANERQLLKERATP